MAFTATTGNSAAAWRPDLFTFEPQDVLTEAVILNHSTVAGRIEGDQPAVRVAYVIDDDADFVAEGATFDEAEPALNEAVVYTRKIGQLIRIAREQYQQNGTADELARSVARALTTKADNAFLAQAAPTSPALAPVAGLLNVTGIQSQTAVATNLDKLIDLEADVRAAGGKPSVWVLAPDTWALLRKLKTATGSAVAVLGSGTDAAEPRLLSIPVEVNNQMPSKAGLLIDKTAVISATSTLEIATSSDQYFSSDAIGVRATLRTGHAVPRPGRIGKFAMS